MIAATAARPGSAIDAAQAPSASFARQPRFELPRNFLKLVEALTATTTTVAAPVPPAAAQELALATTNEPKRLLLPSFVRSLDWFPGKYDSLFGVDDGALIAVLLPMALACFGLGLVRR